MNSVSRANKPAPPGGGADSGPKKAEAAPGTSNGLSLDQQERWDAIKAKYNMLAKEEPPCEAASAVEVKPAVDDQQKSKQERRFSSQTPASIYGAYWGTGTPKAPDTTRQRDIGLGSVSQGQPFFGTAIEPWYSSGSVFAGSGSVFAGSSSRFADSGSGFADSGSWFGSTLNQELDRVRTEVSKVRSQTELFGQTRKELLDTIQGVVRTSRENQQSRLTEMEEARKELREALDSMIRDNRETQEMCRKQSEDARREAEAARQETEAARKAMVDMREEVESARDEAVQATEEYFSDCYESPGYYEELKAVRSDMVDMRDVIESALKETEAARKQTEAALKQTEAARKETKAARKEAEACREKMKDQDKMYRETMERLAAKTSHISKCMVGLAASVPKNLREFRQNFFEEQQNLTKEVAGLREDEANTSRELEDLRLEFERLDGRVSAGVDEDRLLAQEVRDVRDGNEFLQSKSDELHEKVDEMAYEMANEKEARKELAGRLEDLLEAVNEKTQSLSEPFEHVVRDADMDKI